MAMKHVIYIMGVSGSGKTTIGQLLSEKTGIPFFDADDFHSAANKAKMHAGQALTDEDRRGWLITLSELAQKQQQSQGAIIACSALKEQYRITLGSHLQKPVWVFLKGDFNTIKSRLDKRTNHYMPANLLQSQFETLEIPANAFSVDINNEPDEIVNEIIIHINKV